MHFNFLQKDDKDTAFAQAYLNRTKEALKENTEKYEQFLKILYHFGKSEQSPVKVSQNWLVFYILYAPAARLGHFQFSQCLYVLNFVSLQQII